MARLLAVTFDAGDPERVARFWAELLGRTPEPDGDGVLLRGDENQVGLRFVPGEPARTDLRRLHLHLTSADAGQQQRTVEVALGLGAEHRDVGQTPEEGHIVLADPESNELCVIEPHNGYLAGTGFLGEVACDGSPEVGHFWSEVLGWPLVWDQDEETAIQSPAGGTKLAWGGPPLEPKAPRNPQRFELLADEPTEADRLVGLGATRLASYDGADELADPDGNELVLRTAH